MGARVVSDTSDLRHLSLIALLERVSLDGDGLALKELLENRRSPFRLNEGRPLRLIEFVERLREDRQKRRF